MKRVQACIQLFIVVIAMKVAPAYALTGNDWQHFPEQAQVTYVMGVVDTWHNLEQISDAVPLEMKTILLMPFGKVSTCIQDMPYMRMTAIIRKYMENTPSQWNREMASLVWTGLAESCGLLDKPSK